jgi:hAT family protein
MISSMLNKGIILAECERVFSSAKILISDRRNGLKEDIIEACALLRHLLIVQDTEA